LPIRGGLLFFVFFFEKSQPKFKVVLGYFFVSWGQNSRFGHFFVVRTEDSHFEGSFENLRPFFLWFDPKTFPSKLYIKIKSRFGEFGEKMK
jgi:hypothetical protein